MFVSEAPAQILKGFRTIVARTMRTAIMCGAYLGRSCYDKVKPLKNATVELSKLFKLFKLFKVPRAEINITPSNMGKIIATSSSGAAKRKNWDDSYGSCF